LDAVVPANTAHQPDICDFFIGIDYYLGDLPRLDSQILAGGQFVKLHFIFRDLLDSKIRVRVGIFWLQTDVRVLPNQFIQPTTDAAQTVLAQFRAGHFPIASRTPNNRRSAGSSVRSLTTPVAPSGFSNKDFVVEGRGDFGRVPFNGAMRAFVSEVLALIHA
jgi:hypothetical protein